MPLHDYQILAGRFLQERKRAALFMDMGLGKTASVLCALSQEHLPVLVVAPKRVAENVWDEQGEMWRGDLRVAVAAGTPANRRKMLQSGADVVAISRDNFADVLALWPRGGHPFRTVVLDELSGFKSRGARWKTAKKIINGGDVENVWGLTGTPAPNGLLDLWAQVYLLDGGARLGKTLTAYRDRYFTAGRRLPTGVVVQWNPRPEAPVAIQRKLEDIALAMETDGRVQLPSVTFNRVEVPMDPTTRRTYQTMKRDAVVDLELLGTFTGATAAAVSIKLAQISAGFLYDEDRVPTYLHQNKIRAVREIIDGTGAPVLVFYRFAEGERDVLLREIPEARTIDEPGIIKEWNAGRVPVLVCHPQSIGHGLNLQHGGYTAIWTTLPWSLEEWDQSNKRLARQGQQHPVIIHMLMSPGTVDYAVAEALQNKTSVQRALLDHLESPI